MAACLGALVLVLSTGSGDALAAAPVGGGHALGAVPLGGGQALGAVPLGGGQALGAVPPGVTRRLPAPQQGTQQHAPPSPAPLQDGRWRPWVGCWLLRAQRHDDVADDVVGAREVCIQPVGRAVRLVSRVEGRPVMERLVFADGVDRPFEEEGCRGRIRRLWSADGQRLFTVSSARCEDGTERTASGVALFTRADAWVDVQAVSTHDDVEIVVRRYRASRRAAEGVPFGGDLDALLSATDGSRLDLDDVVEAVRMVDPVAVEAVLLEVRPAFELDAESLLALADAGVPEPVIDLVVALSFPDDFIVEGLAPVVDRAPAAAGAARRPVMVGAGYPYWNAWFTPFGFFSPYYPYDPAFVLVLRPDRSHGGRAVAGKGYTRVRSKSGGGLAGLLSRRREGGSRGSSVSSSGHGRVSPHGSTRGSDKSRTRRAKPRGQQ